MTYHQKGFGTFEVLMAITASIALSYGAYKGVSLYQESHEMDNRSLSAADQIIQFSEASYKLTAAVGGLENKQITVNDLKNKSLLSITFPERTPYGQEIKGFLIDNPDMNKFSDLLITTTGSMNPDYIERTGQSKNSPVKIQEKTYYDMRRQRLNLGSNNEDQYSFGKINNNQFRSNGDLYVRDISSFNSEIDKASIQPSVLFTAPNQTIDLIAQIQKIYATPDVVAANDLNTSNIQIAVRNQDGSIVPNSPITWSTTGGTLSSLRTVTNNQGISNVTLRSGVAGIIKVVAKLDNGKSSSVNVTFQNPEAVSLIGSPSKNVNADGKMCANMIATIAYPDGTIAKGEKVSWTTTLGNYKNALSATDNNGKATACLYSRSEGDASSGIVVNRSNSKSYYSIEFVGAMISSANMMASPSSRIPADGKEYANVRARATYPDGSAASGIMLGWSANLGDLSTKATTTDSDGYSTIRISSNRAGNSLINVQVPNGTKTGTTVGFDAANLVSIYADRTSNIKADGSDRSTVSAVVQYPNGKKADNEIIQWNVNNGANLSNSATKTNGSGTASTYVTSRSDGNKTVTASYAGQSKQINLNFKASKETRFDKNNYLYYAEDPEVGYGELRLYWDGAMVYKGGAIDYTKLNKVVGNMVFSWSEDDYYDGTCQSSKKFGGIGSSNTYSYASSCPLTGESR